MDANTVRWKYPRTPHLPWSPGAGSDDIRTPGVDQFVGREVVITEKVDGENTTIYADGHLHARSLDGRHHPSRSLVKGLAARVGPLLSSGWRVCGENVYAAHSISYSTLPSFFLAFSIWDGPTCLGWDETEEWCALLGLETVPVLQRSPWSPELESSLRDSSGRSLPSKLGATEAEGYVIRVSDSFMADAFGISVAKFVREGHVQTSRHWAASKVIPNGVAARWVAREI